ncbi:cutinase-domain-containing protein [Mycena maculata]|uniref:cutinase n=1 Tax=Mycena maculata TaxID=230809 RepID=A0AAD7NY47_9AGAR|nr:cutinase-domain-containing protein [Mycena maculata]
MLRALVTVATISFLTLASPVTERQDACTDVIVIFARGTTEPAPIGTIVDPPLQSALESALGGKTLIFTGVEYPADIAGFLEGGDPAGSTTTAQDIGSFMLSDQRGEFLPGYIISSGYSQGAQLVHNSAKQLSASGRSHQRCRDFGED